MKLRIFSSTRRQPDSLLLAYETDNAPGCPSIGNVVRYPHAATITTGGMEAETYFGEVTSVDWNFVTGIVQVIVERENHG